MKNTETTPIEQLRAVLPDIDAGQLTREDVQALLGLSRAGMAALDIG